MQNLQMPTAETEIMTLADVAEYLRMSLKYLQNTAAYLGWRKFGVKTYKVGKRVFFKRSEIEQMVEKSAIN